MIKYSIREQQGVQKGPMKGYIDKLKVRHTLCHDVMTTVAMGGFIGSSQDGGFCSPPWKRSPST